MDIEGSEVEALSGAVQAIKNFKPKLSICTYHHPDHARQLTELILSFRRDYKTVLKGTKVFDNIPRSVLLHAF